MARSTAPGARTPLYVETPRARGQKMPVPRLYVYFDAVLRYGSIRSAAEALRIASSALNRRIIDLEKDLGTALFERLPTGVRLTAAGEIFAGHVQRMLHDMKLADEKIQSLQGHMSGHMTIGSAESAAIDILPGLMARFASDFPGARFTMVVGTPRELLDGLLEDRLDLILTHEQPTHHDVAVLATARMPLCALMRAGHPLASKAGLMMADCKPFPVVLAEEDLAARAAVDRTLAANALDMQPVLVTNVFEVMKEFIRISDAISFHFHLHGLGGARMEGLVALRLADEQLTASRLVLAARRGRVLPAGAAAFCRRLEQRLVAAVPLYEGLNF
jgi:DNA-binding transcriptional LysR family regulator